MRQEEAMNGRVDRWTDEMPYPRDKRLDAGGPDDVYDGPPELGEVDDLLGRYARRQPTPPGLVDRIFEASVGLLPSRRPRREPLLLIRPGFGGSWASRLAMAASITLAVFVGARLATESGSGARVTTDGADVWLALAAPAGDASVADLDVHPRFRELEESRYGTVERLLVTRNIRFRDLAGDLANIAADLEM
jgi:hypothetical protein